MNLKINWGVAPQANLRELSSKLAAVWNTEMGYVQTVGQLPGIEEGLCIYIPMNITKALEITMGLERKLTLIGFDSVERATYICGVRHGEDFKETRIVAVVEGSLCDEGRCKWCDELREKVANGRVF